MDLLTNLLTALMKAPDSNFQRRLSNQMDLWSVRKKDWKDDGSDLMEEAELYYKEAKSTRSWGKKSSNVDTMAMYAFQATEDSTDETDWKSAYENELKKAATASLRCDTDALSEVAAFTAQLKQF